jgi:hypothetical protein
MGLAFFVSVVVGIVVLGGVATYRYVTAETITVSAIVYDKDVVCDRLEWDEDADQDCRYLIHTSEGTFEFGGFTGGLDWGRVRVQRPATIGYKNVELGGYRQITDIRQETP